MAKDQASEDTGALGEFVGTYTGCVKSINVNLGGAFLNVANLVKDVAVWKVELGKYESTTLSQLEEKRSKITGKVYQKDEGHYHMVDITEIEFV